jgi:hypothetical protein
MERDPPARVAVTVRIIIRVSYHFAAKHRNSRYRTRPECIAAVFSADFDAHRPGYLGKAGG